jgi:flagellar motor switch protein FliM
MAGTLTAELEAPVRIELVEIVQVSRRAFRDAAADLVLSPLVSPSGAGAGEGLIALEPPLALALVDRALGGSATDLPDRKTLTPVELTLLDGVLRRSVESFFGPAHFAANGRFRMAEPAAARDAAAIDAEGSALGVQILLSVGGAVPPGEIRAFLPDPPFRESIGIVSQSGIPGPEEKRKLLGSVMKLKIPLTILLGHARCGAEEVSSLEPGDVIALETPRDAPVVVRIGEKPRLMARFGRKDGRFAVKIGRWLGAKPAGPAPGPAPGTNPKAAAPQEPAASPTPQATKRPE